MKLIAIAAFLHVVNFLFGIPLGGVRDWFKQVETGKPPSLGGKDGGVPENVPPIVEANPV